MKNTIVKTIRNSKHDFIEAEIGDAKQDDFFPQVKIKRFDNEVNFSMRYKQKGIGKGTYSDKDGKLVWKNKNEEVHIYEVTDGYELEAILNEKPETNKVEFTIQTKGLNFFYQPELTNKEKEKGIDRPENIIGSYAVYMKERKKTYTNGKQYRAGKVGHIYRPKIIDANDEWVWGVMSIDEDAGILAVEIHQEFLDKAVYPVRVDPTFGYTTQGGTNYVMGDDTPAIASLYDLYTANDGDLLENIKFYAKEYDNPEGIEASLYRIQSGLPTTKFSGGSVNVNSTTLQIWTITLGGVAMTDGYEYCVAYGGWGGDESASEYNTAVAMDTVSNISSFRDIGERDLPATWNHVTYEDYLPSLWATFTAGPIDMNYTYTIFIDKAKL